MNNRHATTHRRQRRAATAEGTHAEGHAATPSPAQSLETLRNPQADAATRGAALVDLQRVVGNGRVARTLIQRQNQPTAGNIQNATHLLPAMFDVQGGDLVSNGTVIARPIRGDQVTITAPKITFDADVSLRSGMHLAQDAAVLVGPVQTLLGSNRIGVYRRGGVANGEVTTEQHSHCDEVRDAQYREGSDGPKPVVEAPWYSQPSRLSETQRQTTVSFRDQPAMDLPRRIGDGVLTETHGSDRFVTSLAAKQGDQIIHLQSSQWQVPWDLSIDQQERGIGGDVSMASAAFDPPTTDGPIAITAAQDWVSFASVDAALSASTEVLLTNLVPARQNDPVSWHYIAEALRRQNPLVNLTINVVKTAEWFGSDEVEVTIRGNRDVVRGPFSLSEGQSARMAVAFTNLFDPLEINENTTITIRAQDVGLISNPVATMSWDYPFNAQLTPAPMRQGSNERYTMTGLVETAQSGPASARLDSAIEATPRQSNQQPEPATSKPNSMPSPSRPILQFYFDKNSSDLRLSELSDLDSLARDLRRDAGLVAEIQAHASTEGSAVYNQSLSERRAEKVAAYLMDQGISPDRLSVSGHGETRPVLDEQGQEALRAHNRRVDVFVRR